MFKYFILVVFIVCTIHSYSAIAIFSKEPVKDINLNLDQKEVSANVSSYRHLTPLDFKKLTGHKLTLKERIVFKIAQRQLKKSKRKDSADHFLQKNPKEPFKWHWGGFFLGLLLPIVGLIIAALIKDDKKKSRVDSAAIGTLVVCVAFLVFFLSSV